ncbi:hypothetical STE3-type G-protein coupled receptor [Postia placenta Mad-698-R]|nr:hypothetical STE3-type G-protein coupled receptor [Postia placenta Mad-698-R]
MDTIVPAVGLPLASFLAAVLVLLPLQWHWRARNIPTLSIIVWLFIVNLTHGVNAIVWYHNVEAQLVVWCDITTKLDIGANIALPAACFCLCMHLERIASERQAKTTFTDKRRRMWTDLAICVCIPIIYMAMHYIVQGHLFDIVEDFGCRAEDYVSIPEFFIMWLLPILFCLGTFVLSGLAFVHFLRRRAIFARHLANSTSGLTPTRYFRLMAMSLVEMFWAVIVIAITLYFNYRDGLRPWISWANVHSDFSRIGQFPTVLIPTTELRWTYFLWWTTPVSAGLFFIFFAFGADAVKEYGSCIEWLRRVAIHRNDKNAPLAATLPSFCQSRCVSFMQRMSVVPLTYYLSPPQSHFIFVKTSKPESDTCPGPTDSKDSYPERPSTACSTTSTFTSPKHPAPCEASSDPFASSESSSYFVAMSPPARCPISLSQSECTTPITLA